MDAVRRSDIARNLEVEVGGRATGRLITFTVDQLAEPNGELTANRTLTNTADENEAVAIELTRK